MKKLIKSILATLGCVVLMTTLACGDVLTSTSDTNFVKNEVKTIAVSMPANCSAMNGTLKLNNCTAVLSETFPTKDIDTNNDKFILYGMNQDIMQGANLLIDVIVTNDSQAKVEIVDCMGATPDADAIVIADFEVSLYSFLDLNADGLLNGEDVAIVIDYIFDGNMTVVDLQNIINASLEEM